VYWQHNLTLREGGVETRFLRRHQSPAATGAIGWRGMGPKERPKGRSLLMLRLRLLAEFCCVAWALFGCATPKFLLLICNFSPGFFCAVRLMGRLILGGRCWQGIKELAGGDFHGSTLPSRICLASFARCNLDRTMHLLNASSESHLGT
jgi:hypothetical protein